MALRATIFPRPLRCHAIPFFVAFAPQTHHSSVFFFSRYIFVTRDIWVLKFDTGYRVCHGYVFWKMSRVYQFCHGHNFRNWSRVSQKCHVLLCTNLEEVVSQIILTHKKNGAPQAQIFLGQNYPSTGPAGPKQFFKKMHVTTFAVSRVNFLKLCHG